MSGVVYSLAAPGWSYAAATGGISTTTTAVTIAAAPTNNQRNFVTSIQVQSSTLGNATELAIRDGAGGTVLWRTELQTAAVPLLAIEFVNPLMGSKGNLLEVVTLSSATGKVFFNAQGYAGDA